LRHVVASVVKVESVFPTQQILDHRVCVVDGDVGVVLVFCHLQNDVDRLCETQDVVEVLRFDVVADGVNDVLVVELRIRYLH